jgi:hypothetical protein
LDKRSELAGSDPRIGTAGPVLLSNRPALQ